MTESPQLDDYAVNAAALQAEFEALHIPSNIDPRLLALWIEREQNEIERLNRKKEQPPKKFGRSLVRLFPAYIGIAVMCLSILLGLVQLQEPTTILQMACVAFLVYTIVGVFVGMIAEHCIDDSVETLLRDIVNRSRKTGQNVETEQE